MHSKQPIIAVIGLGYVGLPLALGFGEKYQTIGYDTDAVKISDCKNKIDNTGTVTLEDFSQAEFFTVTNDPNDIKDADIFIVAVPTPVDDANIPDFSPLISASEIVAKQMKIGAIVVYESTVYPGATEEICIPVLEKNSNLLWGSNFNVGYSPERVNPGDHSRTLKDIVKVVSGDNSETLEKISNLYSTIVKAGIHRVSSIKVAEASKVIENTQRDLNIALMNELSILFEKMEIDTLEVLEAAGTKWNFLPFRPGLVGGHCIGVDPYYLTYKAEMLGYHPQVILAGRRINDGMVNHVAQQIIKRMIKANINVKSALVTILGVTFKENCPDLRNSKVLELITELADYGCKLQIHDPIVQENELILGQKYNLMSWDDLKKSNVIIAAVPHQEIVNKPENKLIEKLDIGGIFADIKGVFPKNIMTAYDINYWRL